MSDTQELIEKLTTKKDDPNFPLAPFKRLIKIHSEGKNVSSDASVKLQELIFEFSEEIILLANRIANIYKRKTINAQMIQEAYEFIRKKEKK